MSINSPVTYGLIGINILIFLLESASGGSTHTDVARKFGAFYLPDVRRGQWYRLFTAMFIHFGLFHLACNMYSLYNLGPALERFLGWKYILLYVGSGLAGNLATWFLEDKTGKYAISAGASGAIFGLLGAWLVIALMPQIRSSVSLSNLLYVIGINVIYGISNRSVNMTAHIGGFIGGAVITFIVCLL